MQVTGFRKIGRPTTPTTCLRLQTALWLMILAQLGLLGLFAGAEEAPPISRVGLYRAVRIGGLSDDQLAAYLRNFGVDFRPKPSDEKALASMGAPAGVLAAVKAATVHAVRQQHKAEPLTRMGVMLQLFTEAKRNALRVAVAERGVNFLVSPEIETEMRSGGAPPDLIALVALRAQGIDGAAESAEQSHSSTPLKTAGQVQQQSQASQVEGDDPSPTLVQQAPKNTALVEAEDQAKKLIRKPATEYPPFAERAGIKGRVILEARIGKDGRVKSLLEKRGHPALIASALEAARGYVYKPTLVDGVPVEVISEIIVEFDPRKAEHSHRN